MKLRKMTTFRNAPGARYEEWWGTCPKEIAAMRKARPELVEGTAKYLAKKPAFCPACKHGARH